MLTSSKYSEMETNRVSKHGKPSGISLLQHECKLYILKKFIADVPKRGTVKVVVLKALAETFRALWIR